MDRDRLAEQERDKYEKAWGLPGYRMYSPGQHMLEHYLRECRPVKGKLIDFGTGCGRAALALHENGYDVYMIDVADNCLDDDVRNKIGHRLLVATLWDPIDLPKAPEGYCTDVMEHIPPEKVDAVLANMFKLCERVFFQICLHEDHFGRILEDHLHLTVRPFEWWRDKLGEYGQVTDGRDLIGDGWFYVQRIAKN